MVPVSFMVVFAITWCIGVAYVVSVRAMMFKVRRLREPDAKFSLNELFARQSPTEALGLLFTARHRQIGDSAVSRSVMISRTLFAVALPFYVYIFWQGWLLARPV